MSSTESSGERGTEEGHGELGDNLAAIAHLTHVVYRHARLFLARCFHGLMHMVAPHALAPVFGQKGGVKIHDAAWKTLNEVIGDEGKKTGKHDEANAVLIKKWEQIVGRVELRLAHHYAGNAQSFGPYQGVGILTVAHYQGNTHLGGTLEMTDEVLAVGAASRYENRYVCLVHVVVVERFATIVHSLFETGFHALFPALAVVFG